MRTEATHEIKLFQRIKCKRYYFAGGREGGREAVGRGGRGGREGERKEREGVEDGVGRVGGREGEWGG